MLEHSQPQINTEDVSDLLALYQAFPIPIKEIFHISNIKSTFNNSHDAELLKQFCILFNYIVQLTTQKPDTFIPLFMGLFFKRLNSQFRYKATLDKIDIGACLSYINLMLSDSIDNQEINNYEFLKLLNDNYGPYLEHGSILLSFCNKFINTKEALHNVRINQKILIELVEWGFRPTVKKQRPLFLALTKMSYGVFFNMTRQMLKNYLTPILQKLTTSEIVRFNQTDYIEHHFDHDDPPLELMRNIWNIVNSYRYTHHVQYGPINFPASNKVLMQLILAVLDTNIKNIEIMQDNLGFYEIEIPNRLQLINLSMLLKNCDLYGWNMSLENIQDIHDYLKRSFNIDLHQALPKEIKNRVLAKLHPTLQGAIRFYTLDHYENINPLLRGSPSFSFKQDLIGMLLIAILIATALNQMTLLLHSEDVYREEKALLDRLKINEQEAIADTRILSAFRPDENNEFEMALDYSLAEGIINEKEVQLLKDNYQEIKPLFGGHRFLKRMEYYSVDAPIPYAHKNPYRISTFFSTSTRNGQFFIEENPSDMKFHHQFYERFNNQVVISELSERACEEEVLLSPGLQYTLLESRQIMMGKTVLMDAILLRSPEFYRDEYASSAALIHAANCYLDKPYAEISDSQVIFGETLHRPNHGVVHTHAVMKYIPMVVSFFSVHAKDTSFRNFCDQISPVDMECLKIIAAFSVTGRESEAPSKNGSSKTANYRKASANHLRMYLQSLPTPFFSEDPQLTIERCIEITKHFGNHDYEAQFNTASTTQEKQTRSYYHRIISMAHTLDLPRCWSEEEFKQAMRYFNNFIINTERWREDLFQMISHACGWIEKRGDMLNFKVSLNGEYSNLAINYRINFIQNSTDIYLLELRSNKYPSPKFEQPPEEQYQSVASLGMIF